MLLAYALNGAPLPPQHGFPLRLVVPGLVRDDQREVAGPAITAVDAPFTGYQQTAVVPGSPATRTSRASR